MSGVLDPSAVIIADQNGNTLSLNSNGSLSNAPVDGAKATYSVSSASIAPATSATDIFTLTGSTTKIIRVLRAEISGTQSTDGQVVVQLIKRLAANAGGTSSSVVNAISHDTLMPLATATIRSYSANPTTLGSPSTTVRSISMYVPASLTAATASDTIWTFGDRPGQCIVLRGPNEVLAFNLNATTVTGGSFFTSFEWTEE